MSAPRRLVWKCRRGMREMDILLARFLERGYDDLDAPGRAAFERLLDLPDQEILAWLFGAGAPQEPELAALVSRVRDVVHGP